MGTQMPKFLKNVAKNQIVWLWCTNEHHFFFWGGGSGPPPPVPRSTRSVGVDKRCPCVIGQNDVIVGANEHARFERVT